MNRETTKRAEIQVPLREAPTKGWCWQDNELYTTFQPIIGAYAVAIYCTLTAMAFGSPSVQYSVRVLAESTKLSTTTVLRALELTECVRLIRLRKGSGSQKSICEFVDPKALAQSLGAVYKPKTASFMLSKETTERLKAEVRSLKTKQQGKWEGTRPLAIDSTTEDVLQISEFTAIASSRRSASDSLAVRQRFTRETQTGSHLLLEEERIENSPTPTPSHDCQAQEPKDSPFEDEPDELLKCSRRAFIGVIDDIRAHLLDTSRPLNPHLANGFAEWEKFGFNSFAVEAASKHGDSWALLLSASNVEAAQCGVEKYHRKWNEALSKRFDGPVYVQWQADKEKW